jgi:hypothetical protein
MTADQTPHDQVCFSCWLKAAWNVDVGLANALMSVAYRMGWDVALAGLVPEHARAYLSPPKLTAEQYAEMDAAVRRLVSVPPSPDVAEAMRTDHGH